MLWWMLERRHQGSWSTLRPHGLHSQSGHRTGAAGGQQGVNQDRHGHYGHTSETAMYLKYQHGLESSGWFWAVKTANISLSRCLSALRCLIKTSLYFSDCQIVCQSSKIILTLLYGYGSCWVLLNIRIEDYKAVRSGLYLLLLE